MMRTLVIPNPANFMPTEAEATIISERQMEIKRWASERYRDPGFIAHADPTSNRSMKGIVYHYPLMMAKAAMINAGRNVLNHWVYFEIEMMIPWQLHIDMSFDSLWMSVASRMDSLFHRTDMRGSMLSQGAWIPQPVREIDRFGLISSRDALHWLGVTSGHMPHVSHPLGTLRVLPAVETVAAGDRLNISVDAVFGQPPYTPTLHGARPSWVTLDSANKAIKLDPPADATIGESSFKVRVTDAVPQNATATWTVTVTA